MRSTPEPTPSSPLMGFPASELTEALHEQSFGIISFDITESSGLEAVAQVILLENTAMTVALALNGYKLVSDVADEASEKTFESIEDLLSSISPGYVERRQQVLLAKLQLLAEIEDMPQGA